MSEAMNGRENVQTNLSPKVTPTLLDRMYNNFTKLTDWVINGENIVSNAESVGVAFWYNKEKRKRIDELKSLVPRYKRIVTKEQQIVTLANNIAVIDANNKELAKQLSDLVTQQAQASQPAHLFKYKYKHHSQRMRG